MEPPVEASSREVEACRGGDVVEAGVRAILMALAEIGILIYSGGWLSVSQIHQSYRARKTNENAKAMGREFAGVHQ